MEGRVVRLVLWVMVAAAINAAGTGLAASAKPATAAEIALYKGADRQKILEEGARREGKITFYTSGIMTQTIRPLVDVFEKRYPFIKVEIWRSVQEQIIPRVLEEYKSGSPRADCIDLPQTGQLIFTKAGVLQPYYSPNLAYIQEGAIRRAGGEGVLAAAFRESGHSLGYNTKLIAKEELPKTYRDLLNPKWKGKMAMDGSGNAIYWMGTMLDIYGEEFVKQMAEQNITIHMVSARAIADMIINGEYSLSPSITEAHAAESKKKGAPIDWLPLEPVHVNVGYIFLSKNAPHPYAAQLFVDFELSKEVGEIYMTRGYSSTRKDVAGVKNYKKQYGPFTMEESAKWEDLFKKLFLKR